MLRKPNWPLIGFFVVAAAFPFGAFVQEFVFNRCTADVLIGIAKEKPSFGCGEFFLNRYQSAWSALIGVTATLGAAGLAWIAVQRQLAHSNRQTLLSQWQVAMTTRAAMDMERHRVKRATSALLTVSNALSDRPSRPENFAQFNMLDPIQKTADQQLDEVERSGSPWSEKTSEAREAVVIKLRELNLNISRMRIEFVRMLSEQVPVELSQDLLDVTIKLLDDLTKCQS